MRGFPLCRYLVCLMLLLCYAKDAFAAPIANPDIIDALKNEVIQFNVFANDVGVEFALDNYSLPRIGTANVTIDGFLTYTPEKDFVGTVVFGYTIGDLNFPFETSRANITIRFTDPDSNTPDEADPNTGEPNPTDNPAVTSKVSASQYNALLASANIALEGHSRAISQFIKLREAKNTVGSHLAYWQVPRGGAAGDDLLPVGGVFLSLNQQTLESKTEPGLEADIASGTIGADYNISEQWLVGAALGYSDGEQSLAGTAAGDTLDMQEQSFLAFSSYRLGHWLSEVQMGYSSASVENSSNAIDADADAQFALIKGEYAFTGMAWQVMPGLSLKYRRNAIDGFMTDGEQYDNHSQSQLSGVLSVYGSYAFSFNWGVLMPQLTLASDYSLDNSQSGKGVLVDGEWSVLMPAVEDKQQLSIDVGLGAMFTHGLSGFINYHEVSQFDAYSQNGWSIGARLEF